MAGISDKALKSQYAENRYKYNGIEYDSIFGMDEYEAHFRDLDPQTGRWWQLDPKIDNCYESVSPYATMYNDPEKFSDPFGDEGEEAPGCCKVLKQIFASASGTVASFIDNNVPGSNIRGAVASSGIIEDTDVAQSWNTALDESDKASMVQGTTEAIAGEGLKDGGTALTIGSGGTASEISLPAVGVGLGLRCMESLLQPRRRLVWRHKMDACISRSQITRPAHQIKIIISLQTLQTPLSPKLKRAKRSKKIGDKFTKTTEVRPGKGPGQSRAEYVRFKNRQGKVIKTYKDSYDRGNKFQGGKPLRGGPEGRPSQ